MSEHWDAIVVGAGVGGLSAAARLVKAGLRVLVLEKSLHPGGTAYVYTRKGFTFPMGPLGFSSPGLVRHTFADLGQDDGFDLRRVHYQIRAFGLALPVSLPFGQMKENFARLFPADAQGIEKFFDDIDNILAAMRFPEREGSHLLLQRAAQTAARDYLVGLITDWRLRRILGSLGTREAYSGLPLLAAMWNLMANEGIWYPAGGMRSFCGRLVKAVRQGGEKAGGFGQIRLGAEVKEIRVQNAKALGVTLTDGTQIDAANIISNADYKTTFESLVQPDAVPDAWQRAVSRAKQSGSILQVCLGVDATRADLSIFSEASRLIYRRSDAALAQRLEEINWSAPELDAERLTGQELEVSLWSREDPGVAPEGGAVIVIRVEADFAHFAKYRSVRGERVPVYREYKMRLGQALVRETARLIPGLEQAVMVTDVATPLTFEERGGRSEGAVAGWSWNFEDSSDYRPLELVQTAIRNLYMAGYQSYSALFLGGIPTALTSGHRAADALLQGAGPTEEIRIPG